VNDTRPRILAVTDLSPAGDIAVAEAHRRARLAGGTLGVVHGFPGIETVRPVFPHRLADDVIAAAQLPVRAEATLRRRLDTLGLDGTVEVFVEPDSTAEVALRVIERWRPELVVVGAPDDGAVDSERIVRHAPTPVLVARRSPATKRVVVGTDFSDPSLPALRAAVREAEQMHGELGAVHVIDLVALVHGYELAATLPDQAMFELNDSATARLQQALAELGRGEALVERGPAAPALVEVATRRDAELLVVGTHGRTGLTRFLLGSVAETVVRRAPCSVLVERLAG
jgi:universal stress protein A